MKLYILIFFYIFSLIFISSFNGFGQTVLDKKSEKHYMQSTDVYLVQLNIDSVYVDKIFRFGSTFSHKSYRLCKITINQIYYLADSSFITRYNLWNAQFMLIPKGENLVQNTLIDVSLFASLMENVFFMGRLLSEKEVGLNNYSYPAIITFVNFDNRKLRKFISKSHLK
jgi:hypothetical protein